MNTLKFTIMKKIITFLFSIALVSSAFAQGNRHSQYSNQPNDNRNGYGQTTPGNNVYSGNNQQQDRNNENGYGYNNNRGNNERSYGNRNDNRGGHEKEFGHERRMESNRYYWRHPWFNRRFERHDRW